MVPTQPVFLHASVRRFLVVIPILTLALAFTLSTSAEASERVTTFDTFETDEPYIALTFDVTFDRGDGETILNILAERDVRATFALTGVWAQDNPDLVRRMVDEGHDLMNHTWDHPSLTGEWTGSMIHDPTPPLGADEIIWQLHRTEDIVRDQVGVELRPYVRPPYGDYSDETQAAMADAGYTYNIMWTVDTLGWYAHPVEVVTQRALDSAQPGANILMHVGHGATDGAALPGIIDGLRSMGYEFATVEEFVEGRLAQPDAPHLRPEPAESREAFRTHWRDQGGLLEFGLPLTEIDEVDGIPVQYFQHARLEHRPGAEPGQYHVHAEPHDSATARDVRSSAAYAGLERNDDGRCLSYQNGDYRICGRLYTLIDDGIYSSSIQET